MIKLELSLFHTSSEMTLSHEGGDIMAWMDSSHPEAVSRHSRAQK